MLMTLLNVHIRSLNNIQLFCAFTQFALIFVFILRVGTEMHVMTVYG